MTLEEILTHWDVDSIINPTDLGNESIREPKLHSKYLRWLTVEKELLRAYEVAESIKLRELYEFYTQGPSKEQWKDKKWMESFPPKGSVSRKSELEIYINSDEDYLKIKIKLDAIRIKVDTLNDIIRQIHRRGYVVAQGIADAKFKAGIG